MDIIAIVVAVAAAAFAYRATVIAARAQSIANEQLRANFVKSFAELTDLDRAAIDFRRDLIVKARLQIESHGIIKGSNDIIRGRFQTLEEREGEIKREIWRIQGPDKVLDIVGVVKENGRAILLIEEMKRLRRDMQGELRKIEEN